MKVRLRSRGQRIKIFLSIVIFWQWTFWYLRPGWGYQRKIMRWILNQRIITENVLPGLSFPSVEWLRHKCFGLMKGDSQKISDDLLGETRFLRAGCRWDWGRWCPWRRTDMFLLIQMTLKHREILSLPLCYWEVDLPTNIHSESSGYVPAMVSSAW